MANCSSPSFPVDAGQVPRLPLPAVTTADGTVAAPEVSAESVVPRAPVQSDLSMTAGSVCSRCGGSGRLRINDDSFRTCLDCLGQGVLPRYSAQSSLSEWIAPAQLRAL